MTLALSLNDSQSLANGAAARPSSLRRPSARTGWLTAAFMWVCVGMLIAMLGGLLFGWAKADAAQPEMSSHGRQLRFAKVVVMVPAPEHGLSLRDVSRSLGIPSSAIDPAFGMAYLGGNRDKVALLVEPDAARQIELLRPKAIRSYLD